MSKKKTESAVGGSSAKGRTASRTAKKKAPAKLKSETFAIPIGGPLLPKFRDMSKAAGMTPAQLGERLIDNCVSTSPLLNDAKRHARVKRLAKLIGTLPGVKGPVAHNASDQWFWWVKFTIDTRHALAWHVIQRLGYVFNYYSIEQHFDTKFMPVSPPPDLNGGPRQYLSWVVEATLGFYDPGPSMEALRRELPQNVKSKAEWMRYDDA